MIKRVSYIVVCAVTIFVMIFNSFVPVTSYADGWAVDWFGSEQWKDKKNNLQAEDKFYLQLSYGGYSLLGFSLVPSVSKVSVNEYYDKIILTFNNIPEDGIFINSYGYSYGTISYSGRSVTSRTVLEYTCNKDTSYSSEKIEEEDTSFLGRLEKGLKDFFIGTLEADKFLLTGDTFDYFKKISHDFSAFVGDTLGITGDTLKDAIENIYNDDYSGEFWTGVDNQKIKQIQGTSNNMKRFWYDNITVVNDNEDGSSYHYDVKNYNPVNNTYPDYFYNDNYFYEYLLYNIDTNNDDVVYWLKRIYSILVDYFSKDSEDVSIDESSNEEFLKQLKTIIVKKIPLWSQCIEILEPVTNTCIDTLDNDTIDLIEDNHTALLTEKYNISSLNSDSQLDIDTTYDTMLFNNLLIITTDVGNNVLCISIPVNQNWLGYEFKKFDIPFSHYYNNFRQRISDLLLFLGWLLFAWSVIHRTSKLFGHNSSSKE